MNVSTQQLRPSTSYLPASNIAFSHWTNIHWNQLHTHTTPHNHNLVCLSVEHVAYTMKTLQALRIVQYVDIISGQAVGVCSMWEFYSRVVHSRGNLQTQSSLGHQALFNSEESQCRASIRLGKAIETNCLRLRENFLRSYSCWKLKGRSQPLDFKK